MTHTLLTGAPRSGTTFLLRYLQCADSVDGLAGVVWPSTFFGCAEHAGFTNAHDLSVMHSFAIKDLQRKFSSERAHTVAELLQRNVSVRDAVRRVSSSKIHHLIYKEPFAAYSPSFLDAVVMGGGRVLIIVRDGRDVAASMVRSYGVLGQDENEPSWNEAFPARDSTLGAVPWWVEPGEEELYISCSPYDRSRMLWTRLNRGLVDWIAKESDANAYLVRYETLLADGSSELDKVLSWLGWSENRRMKKRRSSAVTSSIGKHRRGSGLGAQQAEIPGFEELMRQLGYDA